MKPKRNRSKKIIGFLLILLGIVISLKTLVPMVLGIVSMYLTLTILYTTLDTTYKFFGGIFFLFVSWYIFSSLSYWVIKLFSYGYSLTTKEIEEKSK